MLYRIRWRLAGLFSRVYTLVMFKGVAVTGIVAFLLSWSVLIILSDPNTSWLVFLTASVGLVFLVLGFAQVFALFEAVSDRWAVGNHLASSPISNGCAAKPNANSPGSSTDCSTATGEARNRGAGRARHCCARRRLPA